MLTIVIVHNELPEAQLTRPSNQVYQRRNTSFLKLAETSREEASYVHP